MALTRRFGDEDKSGLSSEERGTFRCSHALEPLFLILSAAFFVGGVVMANSMAWGLFDSVTYNYDKEDTVQIVNAFQNSSAFMAIIMVSIILVAGFVAFTLLKMSISGRIYRYTADEKWFSVSGGGETESILYSDVNSVDYEPLRLFFRDRGYKVTIKTTYREYTYRYLFPKNAAKRTPETSPFFIIEVRAGLYKDFSWQ